MLPTPRASPPSGKSINVSSSGEDGSPEENLQLLIHRFNQMFSIPTFMRNGTPATSLGPRLSELFQTALRLSRKNDTIHQNTIRRLATGEGLERITELTDAIAKTLTHQARVDLWHSQLRPFILILTKFQSHTTSLESFLRVIYNFLAGSDLVRLKSMYQLICDVAQNWKTPEYDSNGATLQELCDISLEMLHQTLQTVPVNVLVIQLRAVASRLKGVSNASRKEAKEPISDRITKNAKSIFEILDKKETYSTTAQQYLSNGQDLTTSNDHPGNLSPHGTRHDNDHASITDIRIFPTTNEILSVRLPYLPLYDPSTWHVQGLRGLLDRHFRLLREDNLGPVREVIRTYLQGGNYSTGMYHGNNLRTNEYTVQNIVVSYDRIDGFELHLSIKQPNEIASRRTPNEREQWWVGTQNLDWERLVCLISHGYAMFCIVSRTTCRTLAQLNEKRDKLKKKMRFRRYDKKRTLFTAGDFAYLVLLPVDLRPSDIDFMLNVHHHVTTGITVVEFPTLLLASFKPMLSTLQEMSTLPQVPLGEYLAGRVRECKNNTEVVEHVPPPIYAMGKFKFNLKPLMRNQSDLLYSAEQEPQVKELCARSSLDQGQAKALLNTLRRSLALIQGPPGTGKSYTGEAIIEVLLANKSKANLGPIICICQTNHALDQLLEHLYLRKGIRRIVRLGSQSRSSIIEGLTLQKIMDSTPVQQHEQIKIGKLIKNRKRAAGDVIKALAELKTADADKHEELLRKIHELNLIFETHAKAAHDGWDDSKVNVLRGYDIIGVTTAGLACFRDMLSRVMSKVVLCEEAGEVLESHTLCALMPHMQHLILIGDHQQLRPTTNNYDFQIANPHGKPYSFDISLFERLVKPLLPSDKKLPFDTLDVQRRMHPAISNLVRSTLYPKLQDDESVRHYPDLAGFKKRLFWFHHTKFEDGSNPDRNNQFSFSNRFEIEVVKTILGHLNRQNVYGDGEIAVLTPYAGQLRQLKTQLSTTYDVSMNELDTAELEEHNVTVETSGSLGKRRIRVATVDNFQGEEASVVVISLVRSNAARKCGFLSQSNRINVLLSRAKHGMIIIGNAETYSLNDMWWEIIQIMQENGNLGTAFELHCPRHKGMTILAATSQQFSNGKCSKKCGRPLRCGHSCTGTCHPKVIHDKFKCQTSCEAVLGCGHTCTQPCHHGRSCGPCTGCHAGGEVSHPKAGLSTEIQISNPQVPPHVPFAAHRTSSAKTDNSSQSPADADQADSANTQKEVSIGTPYVSDNLAKLDVTVSSEMIKYVSACQNRLREFELALLDVQKCLETDVPSAAYLKTIDEGGYLDISGQPFAMIQAVRNKVSGRYDLAILLLDEINRYLREVQMEDKRSQNLLADSGDNQSGKILGIGKPVCQVLLSAILLLVRCNTVILADYVTLRSTAKNHKTAVSIDLAGFFRICEFVVATAEESCYPRQEAVARVLYGKIMTMSRAASGQPPGINEYYDAMAAKTHLRKAFGIVLQHQCLNYLIKDIETVNEELSQSTLGSIVTSNEKRSPAEATKGSSIYCRECDAPVERQGLDAHNKSLESWRNAGLGKELEGERVTSDDRQGEEEEEEWLIEL